MKTIRLSLVLAGLALALFGCETRSISDSGYNRHFWGRQANPFYRGELSELDVLGVAPKQAASDEAIQKALASSQSPRPKRGDRILLIQSGAITPDNAMIEEASKYFEIASFSGTPPAEKTDFAASLRLRAAQGGFPYLVCYWGVLESARVAKGGSAVSWVPLVGSFVPDEKQQMRIRLKALVLDVSSGNWRMLTPESYSDARWTTGFSRERKDQEQVELLKQSGYKSLVADILK